MKKTLIKSFVLAILGLGLVAGNVMATMFSPNNTQILSMTELWDNPDGCAQLLDFSATPAGNEFLIKFTAWDANGFAQIGLGNSDYNFFDLSIFDSYALTFQNTNFYVEDMFVSLFVQTYENGSWHNFYQTDWVQLAYNGTATLSMNFTGTNYYLNNSYQGVAAIGDPSKVFAYGFQVGNNEVTDYSTQIAHGAASPVPEPSTILLMGFGLLGALGYSRKRFLKKRGN